MPAFQNIEFLILILLLPVLTGFYLYAQNKKKVSLKKIGEPALIKQLIANHNPSAYRNKFILALLVLFFLIVASGNLRSKTGKQNFNLKGIDVMIALDVSKSMLAADIKPSRLVRAKQALARLVEKLGNDRVGLVIFAGKAYLQMPLTPDLEAAKMYLSAVNTESVPAQGTVISDALKLCAASFNPLEKKYKAIVLVSDGEDHDEDALRTASDLGRDGVLICTVGIGSQQGAPIMDDATGQFKTDAQGNTIISKLNEQELKAIAEKGNGRYLLFRNADEMVEEIQSELTGMDKRGITGEASFSYRNYFQYFLAVALLLLLAELFITEKKEKNNAFQKYFKLTSVFLFLFVVSGFAQNGINGTLMGSANMHYSNGEFAKAKQAYKVMLNKSPENAAAWFNLGNANFRSGEKQLAVKAFLEAENILEDKKDKSNAAYNRGVSLQIEKELDACIDAYKKSLVYDPLNEDARHNLQLALRQKKEQQKQQEKEKNKKGNEKKEKPESGKSGISKKEAEEKLKALMQQEKNLQDKLNRANATGLNKKEKDW